MLLELQHMRAILNLQHQVVEGQVKQVEQQEDLDKRA
jgi:hypothetical protein